MFMRPLKTIKTRRRSDEKVEKRLEKSWDAIWVTPQELIAEGILVSKQVCLYTHTHPSMFTSHKYVSHFEVHLHAICVQLVTHCLQPVTNKYVHPHTPTHPMFNVYQLKNGALL